MDLSSAGYDRQARAYALIRGAARIEIGFISHNQNPGKPQFVSEKCPFGQKRLLLLLQMPLGGIDPNQKSPKKPLTAPENRISQTSMRKKHERFCVKIGNSKTQTTEKQLAEAVETNAAERMLLGRHLPWIQVHEDQDVIWCFAGDTWPGNYVAYARFAASSADRRIQEILACHTKHKVACTWVVGTASQPVDLGGHLKKHGFSCRLHCAAMACNLEYLGAPPPNPKCVSIALVDNPPSLRPVTTERRQRRFEGRRIIAKVTPRKSWYFSARIDGQPVGETQLFEGKTVAGIYDVEVLEKFRRRGIGSALIHAALKHGRDLGHKTAVLGATGMGCGVYARQGFRELGKLSFWRYGKMRQLS